MPWWAAVTLTALGVRLAYLLLLREPLLSADQYHYLFGGLRIARHDDPLGYVLYSDDWRHWVGRWTRPPLYTLFAALGFMLGGERLLPLQLANCVLGALCALGVAALARRLAGRIGVVAGLAQAVYWPAVQLSATTLSENLHVPLLVGALWLLARGASEGRRRSDALGGFLLGLSALTRSVSAAFVPLAGLWRFWVARGRSAPLAGVLVLAGAATAILPWTARNAFLARQPALIDSVGAFNLWKDNVHLRDGQARDGGPLERDSPRAVPRVGAAWLLETVAGNPGAWLAKVRDNLRHLLRLEGLHLLLREEFPQPAWRHAGAVVFDDGLLVLASGLALCFAVCGPASPGRSLLLAWLGCYLFLLAGVFHVEIRYRSALAPFLFVMAAAGAAALGGAGRRRRRLALALLPVPLLAAALAYGAPAWRALRAQLELEQVEAALERGDPAGASAAAGRAAACDPGSARPWLAYGSLLAHARLSEPALRAYDEAARRRPESWAPAFVRPQLSQEAGRPQDAERARRRAAIAGQRRNAWLGLEVAWSQLPAPRVDAIALPRDEYGAARGFHPGTGGLLWTGRRARLRLEPATPAAAYEVRLELASPLPSPHHAPSVEVRSRSGPAARFVLTRTFRSYTLQVPAEASRPLELEIRAPTWLELGLRGELGVAVRGMTVAPRR